MVKLIKAKRWGLAAGQGAAYHQASQDGPRVCARIREEAVSVPPLRTARTTVGFFDRTEIFSAGKIRQRIVNAYGTIH